MSLTPPPLSPGKHKYSFVPPPLSGKKYGSTHFACVTIRKPITGMDTILKSILTNPSINLYLNPLPKLL